MADSPPPKMQHTSSRMLLASARRMSNGLRMNHRKSSAFNDTRRTTVSVEDAPSSNSKGWAAMRRAVIKKPQLLAIGDQIKKIVKLLHTAPEDRIHVKLLYGWMMRQDKLSSLFTTLSEGSALKLCKEMEIRNLSGGDAVVHQGDKGNTCFILLSGVLAVYVRSPEEQKAYERLSRNRRNDKDASSGSKQHQLKASPSHRKTLVDLSMYGKEVAKLLPGATFGELCLIEPDSKRSATIIVDPDSQVASFIVLTAASYLRLTRSQTIDGTITDHIAFLHHTKLFQMWEKMELMHLINGMKYATFQAGEYIVRKGTEADSLFIFLRGEAQECINLIPVETAESCEDGKKKNDMCIAVELTFLGKFDIAGEYLVRDRQHIQCPVDLRASTKVDCLVLSKKMFALHFLSSEIKPEARKTLHRLRRIAKARDFWRDSRITMAWKYPSLRVPVTRKLMRHSGNLCATCGRTSHVAGDELCMDLDVYFMLDEKIKKKEKDKAKAELSDNRVSCIPPTNNKDSRSLSTSTPLTPLTEDKFEGNKTDMLRTPRSARLGRQLVEKQWKVNEDMNGYVRPNRPKTTCLRQTSSPRANNRMEDVFGKTHAQLVSGNEIGTDLQAIRQSWPYKWSQRDTQQSARAHSAAPSSILRLKSD